MKSVYKFTLDLHEMIAPIRIDAKVGDTARELEISFLERGIPWAIPAGTTATISDGTTTDTTFSASGETVTWNELFVVAEDKITYRLNGAFTAAEGTKKLEFKLIGTDGVLYTSTFTLNVYGKVTPNVDPEILTPTTLDDLDEMLQGLQTALEDIDSLKAQGYLITGLTVNANCQLVVTMENAEGTEWVYTSDSLKAPVFTLNWYNNPTEAQKTANAAVIAAVCALDPGEYELVINISGYTIPAMYVNSSGKSVIGISLQDGTSLHAYQFKGNALSNYQQSDWNYVNPGTFDPTSDNAASQASVAAYVEAAVDAAKAVHGTLTLSTNWTDNEDGTFSQSVTLSDVTAKTQVDLKDDADVMLQLADDDVYGIYIENNAGTLTAIAINAAPSVSLTIPFTREELA